MQVVNVKEVHISDEAMCVAEQTFKQVMFSVAAKKSLKTGWADRHELWIEQLTNRVFIPVCAAYARFFWMDAITGTLYDQHGSCKTSEHMRINTLSLKRDQVKAKEMLMESAAVEA